MNNTIISHRAQSVKPSASLALASRVNELKKRGEPLINLSVGEPDFDTPEHIKAAAIKAIQDGFTKYTAVEGIISLREAIVTKLWRDNSLKYSPDQILVSCGAKHSFYNLCQAVLNEGDEVIIPAPYWVSYPEIVKLAGGIPIILSTDLTANFKITADELAQVITPKTKLLVLNSPSNPSGMVYTKNELMSLATILLNHPQILIASDDIYENIIWNHTPFANIVNCASDLKDRTIVINGVSKTYAMTGWRIGYAAGNTSIIAAMKKIQSQSISHPTSVAQVAACAALSENQDCVKDMLAAYKQRHDFLFSHLKKIDGFKCFPSDGTFYSFVDISGAMNKLALDSDVKFTELLLEKTKIAVLPGSAFGSNNHIRISFATSMKNLERAVEKLNEIKTSNYKKFTQMKNEI